MNNLRTWYGSIFIIALLWSCGDNAPKFNKEPIDNLVRDYSKNKNYTILLYDMDYDEAKEQYQHQYQIVYAPLNNEDTLLEKTTEWLPVSPAYFETHVNDMGMALVTNQNGKVEKKVSPPGYNNYVGNDKYGEWKKDNSGTSFWAFYGQYAFMRSMFGFGYGSIGYGGWNDYRRNYAPYGRTYYGRNNNGSGTRFGTSGQHTTNSTRTTKWNSRSKSFKQGVRSKVKQSASKSRSSSRYRSSSSSRSRGFGGGK